MSIGLPNVQVIFQGLANTAVVRSSRGVACLIIKDNTSLKTKAKKEKSREEEIEVLPDVEETEESKIIKEYNGFTEVNKEEYTDKNYKIIEDVFITNIKKLFVIKIPNGKAFDDIKPFINKEINWIAYIGETKEEQKKLADFVKLENKTRTKRLKAICYDLEKAEADDMHIVNFANKSVTKTDGTTVVGYEYLGRLLGVLAGCRMDMSVTYTVLTDLKNVQEIGDTDKINEAIGKGKLVLINDDDGVRISRGVNSLQTNDKNHTEDMKYIAIVEAMDLIYEDIINTFKKVYLGRFKNSYDNQVLFISAVNSYFRDLAREEVLDPNYKNIVYIDTEKQREIWVSNGKIEAQNWNDIEVKNNTFRTNVYLQANVKFLNAMEDLLFIVNM
ncbi:phage tail sheath C-terminal domain-containing protein [[Clostridium] colinum]|uniref:phage tail sheath C-terminal domain-containing protein n=1 Tax=[Clostridium] colinum TaxID=36835 RepID=UPI0020243A1D|nr:phage tail sheath C-terminal domain-containing protein [[Clostridium] colinum]